MACVQSPVGIRLMRYERADWSMLGPSTDCEANRLEILLRNPGNNDGV